MRGLLPSLLILTLLAGCRESPRKSGSQLPLLEASYTNLRPVSAGALRLAWDAANQNPENDSFQGRFGMLLLAHGQARPAAAAFARAVELQPENFAWLYCLGRSQADSGNPAEALNTLKRAAQKKPNFVPLQWKIAETLLANGKLAESEQLCRTILTEHPKAIPVHTTLAAVYEKMGNAEKAREETALAAAPPDGTADNQDDSLHDPWMDAVQALRPPEQQPASPPKSDPRAAHFDKGRELMIKKKFKEAIDELKQTLTPEDGETIGYLFALSRAYALAGDASNAIKFGARAKAMALEKGKTQLATAIDEHLTSIERAATPGLRR